MTKRSLVVAALAVGLIGLAGCPGGAGVPGVPGGGGKVDPNTCGNYAANDAGRKLKAFLEATVTLDAAVRDTENYLLDTCKMMGAELGVSDTSGGTKEVCDRVSAALKEHLQLGIKAEAKLKIDYTPAVCEVNVEAAASAAAECEGKASADVAVRCEGTCSGTCNGTCKGKCEGKAGTGGSGGECQGKCEGTCEGSCSGGCDGHADVQADASCKAKAEVSASVEAKCTEPELKVDFDLAAVVDKAKLEAAVAAIKKGLPRLLLVQKKVSGPLLAAFKSWAKAAGELKDAGSDLANSFGDQALCISGQIAGAVGMMANIQASVDVQIEVSASVSGSAGAGGG
jgi:modification target Cys-rich repeat protein